MVETVCVFFSETIKQGVSVDRIKAEKSMTKILVHEHG